MTQRLCPNCQSVQLLESKFCRTCGTQIGVQTNTNISANTTRSDTSASAALTLPLDQTNAVPDTKPIRKNRIWHSLHFRWKGVFAFFVSGAIMLAVSVTFLPRNTSEYRDFEIGRVFDNIEKLTDPYEKWLHSTPEGPRGCDEGNQIATPALRYAEQVAAFDTEELGSFRATKPMAKYEYMARCLCWAASVAEACGDVDQAIAHSRKVLEFYNTVRGMRQDLFARNDQSPNAPGLREVAQDIENVTAWCAARAACILYLHGQYNYIEAYKLAQLAVNLFPDQRRDPWMDKVLNVQMSASSR